jgi:hypothetical protein
MFLPVHLDADNSQKRISATHAVLPGIQEQLKEHRVAAQLHADLVRGAGSVKLSLDGCATRTLLA